MFKSLGIFSIDRGNISITKAVRWLGNLTLSIGFLQDNGLDSLAFLFLSSHASVSRVYGLGFPVCRRFLS